MVDCTVTGRRRRDDSHLTTPLQDDSPAGYNVLYYYHYYCYFYLRGSRPARSRPPGESSGGSRPRGSCPPGKLSSRGVVLIVFLYSAFPTEIKALQCIKKKYYHPSDRIQNQFCTQSALSPLPWEHACQLVVI